MLKFPSRWLFFLSSYIPLYILLIVKDFDFSDLWKNLTASNMVLLGLSVFSGLFIFLLLSSKDAETISINKINAKREEVLSYYITYLIPLLTFEPGKINSIIVTVIVFFTIGVLYTVNGLLHWNPTLSMVRYKLYSVDDRAILLSKKSEVDLARAVLAKDQIIAKQIIPGIYVEKKIIKFIDRKL